MTPDPHHNFWDGLAHTGWALILVTIAAACVGLLLTFAWDQLIAGAIGGGIVLVAVAFNLVEWPTKGQRHLGR